MPVAPSKPFRFHLDSSSGVPVYRQIVDQVHAGVAAGALRAGDQLPTVRQMAVDLAINPNTVVRAYREMEIRGMLETQQGTGTFISKQEVKQQEAERQRRLAQCAAECAAKAGAAGLSIEELIAELRECLPGPGSKRR
jgi:GntR family transcriptional regulator